MSLRQVRIGHHRLAKLFQRACAIVLLPVEQPEARMDLCIIRLQLKGFFITLRGPCRIVLARPGDTEIVMAGWQFRALLGGISETASRHRRAVCSFQRSHALENQPFSMRQPIAELVQAPLNSSEFLLGSGKFFPWARNAIPRL